MIRGHGEEKRQGTRAYLHRMRGANVLLGDATENRRSAGGKRISVRSLRRDSHQAERIRPPQWAASPLSGLIGLGGVL